MHMTGQEEYEVTYCTINTLSVGIFSSTQQQQQQRRQQQQKENSSAKTVYDFY